MVFETDLVDVAKRIVNNRWHKITQKDEALAESINLKVHEYFAERASAFNFNKNNINDDDQLDDDEWVDEDDDWNEDDDWENAQDDGEQEEEEEEKTNGGD